MAFIDQVMYKQANER